MGFQFQGNGFSVSREWVFSFREMGFKLDFGEEQEDEDDTGCWGRTRFRIVRVLFRFQVNTIWDCLGIFGEGVKSE